MNQIALALLILAGLIIPFSLVAIEYRKEFREFQCRKCNHNFKVSYLRLALTIQFRGKDPVPTGTAAYHLKCPKCGDKSWLVPLE
jgi:transcription elongation factor Elf1